MIRWVSYILHLLMNAVRDSCTAFALCEHHHNACGIFNGRYMVEVDCSLCYALHALYMLIVVVISTCFNDRPLLLVRMLILLLANLMYHYTMRTVGRCVVGWWIWRVEEMMLDDWVAVNLVLARYASVY